MKGGEILSAVVAALALTGCSLAASKEHTPAPQVSETSPDISIIRKQAASIIMEEGQSARTAEQALRLYNEVRRLNDSCVQAGGGVSGSPDCDAASFKESELEKLGYCIDYPNKETLTRCSEVVRRP